MLRTRRSALLALSLLAATCAPRPPERLNLVLIVLDTLRPDHLGCYGYSRDTSPALDRWAAKSVLFENAQSAAPWTAPSVASLLTSLYPSVHNVAQYPEPGRMNEHATTLAEVLARRGYATGAFTEGGYCGPQFGLDQGFGDFPIDARHVPGEHAPSSAKQGRLSDNVERALTWIDGVGRQPFFLLFHTYETHTPYLPPEELVRRYRPDWDEAREHARLEQVRSKWRDSKELDAAELELLVAHREHCAPANDLDTAGLDAQLRKHGISALEPRRLELWRDLYDAEVRFTDAQLERLLGRLESAPLAGRTVVVIVSDHGEAFGEHGRFGHGGALHEECLRVLLLIRAPDATPRRVPDLVRTIDVMPTALDLLSVVESAPPMQGRSLAPLLSGAPLRGAPSFSHAVSVPGRESRLWSVRDGRWRLVWDDERRTPQLFDLAADPGELRDVAGEQPQITTRMLGLMRAQCEADALFRARAAGPTRAAAGSQGRELQHLGYAAASEPLAGSGGLTPPSCCDR